ncbi:unnamed protein product [Urochloa humidicola]
MVRSWWGLLLTIFATVQNNEFGGTATFRRKIAYIIAMVQGLVLFVILCPLMALYMLGLYISAGVSLWRLIEHIEHNFSYKGGANMKPALLVLYGLAVAQGLLFGYKTAYALLSGDRLAKFAADGPGMLDKELLAEYLEETVARCEKDPSFATGRNLVTYGVDLLMEAKSNEGILAGIRVLGRAVQDASQPGRKVLAKHLLTRSDSSSHMIRRLLEAVGPRSPYSTEIRTHAARMVALVAHGIRLEQFPGVIECISSVFDPSADDDQHNVVSVSIDIVYQNMKYIERFDMLEDFELQYLQEDHRSPGSSNFSLSSIIKWLNQALRGTSESSGTYQRQRQNTNHAGFDGLLEQAMEIIHRLAVDEENRRVMANAVLHKFAMAPLKLHGSNHDVILKNYWVQWLMAAIKETSSQWQILDEGWQPAAPAGEGGGRGENIQGDEERERLLRSSMVSPVLGIAINNIKRTIKSIFDCPECGETQKKQAIQILLYLSLDMSCITMNSADRTTILKSILQLIINSTDDDPKHWLISSFTNRVYISTIRHLARQKLQDLGP